MKLFIVAFLLYLSGIFYIIMNQTNEENAIIISKKIIPSYYKKNKQVERIYIGNHNYIEKPYFVDELQREKYLLVLKINNDFVNKEVNHLLYHQYKVNDELTVKTKGTPFEHDYEIILPEIN